MIGRPGVNRWVRLLRLPVLLWAAVALAAALPNLWGMASGIYTVWVPVAVRDYLPYVAITLVLALLQIRPGWWLAGWDRAEGYSRRILVRAAGPVIGVVAAVQFLAWFPQYLTWPWWADTEHFAVTALMWDAGFVPYRDLVDFNFPGPTYACWVLGRTAGWGRTAPLYALDAAWLAGLGGVLLLASRRAFGSVLGGATGYLIFLTYYLSLNNSQVAQRDWYVALLMVLGLVPLLAWPGRLTFVASALAFAAALSVRPYPVLFAPAILSAVAMQAPGTWPRRARAAAAWCLFVAVFYAVMLAPLAVAGAVDDYFRSLVHIRPGGNYGRPGAPTFGNRLLAGWQDSRLILAVVGCALALVFGPTRYRRAAAVWLLALAGASLYRPVSPIPHDYLGHPVALIASVSIGFAVGVLVSARRPAMLVKAWLLACLLGWQVNWVPRFCDIPRSVDAVRCLASGVSPFEAPLGCLGDLRTRYTAATDYTWNDYQDALGYLRRHTGRETYVANLLRRHPYPPVNGPVGRKTPFRFAHAVAAARWTRLADEQDMADALARVDNGVVIWAPNERADASALELPTVLAAVRLYYEREAAFGVIEVWRRKRPTHSSLIPATGRKTNRAEGVAVECGDTMIRLE